MTTVILVICVAPFIAMRQHKIKRERHRAALLNTCATEHGCEISQREFCGNFAIGIDKEKKAVCFARQTKAGDTLRYIPLAEYSACKSSRKTRSLNGGGRSQVVFTGIDLAFTPKQAGAPEIRLELYSEHENAIITGEVECAEKWAGLISQQLNGQA